MQVTDAMVILVKAFQLDGVLSDLQGNPAYMFTGEFEFTATELDAMTVRLSAQMSGLGIGSEALARRMLEANLSGVETGAGAMAPDPVGSGLYALVEVVPVASLSPDDFRKRVVDFMLYVEYWRAEGISNLLAEMRREATARNVDADAIVMRG